MATGEYVTSRPLCRVRRDKAILVPLVEFAADGLNSILGIATEPSELESQAQQVLDSMRDLALRIDGIAVADHSFYALGPRRFSADLPGDPNFYSCTYEVYEVTGPRDGMYAVGYFILLPPPEAGTHTIEYAGTYSFEGWDFVNSVRVTLIVD
jgi:hypothetical protein